MRKAFLPVTVVPGAVRAADPDTLLPLMNKKGKPVWKMPQPARFVEHTGAKGPIKVPIYRGTDASLARYIKSQMRRAQRKQLAERQKALEVEVAEKLNAGDHNVEDPII